MSQALLNSACSSLAHQEKLKAQAWLELMTSLKIELELGEKPKNLSLAWLGLIN